MRSGLSVLSIATLLTLLIIFLTACGGGSDSKDIIINGQVLTEEQKEEFLEWYGVLPDPGRYWYDSVSGLTGVVGSEAAASLDPDLPLGQVARNASKGDTGVIVNGRELTQNEVDFLEALFEVDIPENDYTLDAFGNIYANDDPFSSVNIYFALQQSQGQGDNFWSTKFGSAGNSSGGCSYVSIPNTSGPSTFVSSGCG